MNEKEAIEKFVELEFEIQKRYKPLDWLDLSLWVEDGKGSITFGNNAKSQTELKFFNECRQIKDFIQSKVISSVIYEFDPYTPPDGETIEA